MSTVIVDISMSLDGFMTASNIHLRFRVRDHEGGVR
jgi:hypothetical protein